MKSCMKNENQQKIIVPEGKFCSKCPYLDSSQYCKFTGTYQDGYNLQTYCLSSSNWLKCANYEAHGR
jgi:hypothetical protein